MRWLFLLLLLPLQAYAAQPAKLNIVASFSITADMARQVAGDDADVAALVPAGNDMHAYEPTAADLRTLARADIILLNGLGFEVGIEKLLRSGDIHAKPVILSSGVTPLLINGTEPDPHAWMDVANAMRYVITLREALIVADASHADHYRMRAEAYLAKLAALDGWAKKQFSTIPPERRRAVTTHDALQYFGKAYGIIFIPALNSHREGESGAGDLAQLITRIRSTHVTAIFLENLGDPRLMQQLAEETGIHIGGELYSDTLAPSGEGSDYISLITHDVTTILHTLEK